MGTKLNLQIQHMGALLTYKVIKSMFIHNYNSRFITFSEQCRDSLLQFA